MKVEVVYARPRNALAVELDLAEGTSVEEALSRARETPEGREFPARAPMSIWGELVDPSSPVRDGDRVEVLRPLRQSPVEWRRRQAIGMDQEPDDFTSE